MRVAATSATPVATTSARKTARMRTSRGSAGDMLVSALGEGKLDVHDESLASRARRLDASAVRLDRPAHDREAEAGAVRLQREERLEEPGERLGRHARTRIADADRRRPVPAPDAERQPTRTGDLAERVERVVDQIDEDLAHLLSV